jgi:phosphoribosylglycinamide formyltransferase-1
VKLGFLASPRGSDVQARLGVARCRVPVMAGDTPDALAARVLERAHVFLVDPLARVVAGDLALR